MKTEKIYTLHEDNKEWASSLAFYKDELKIMEKRLQEIASKYTSKEVLAHVEQFQNQFIIRKMRIDEINHMLNLNNDAIQKEINKNPVAVDHRRMEAHADIEECMVSFDRIFKADKSDFNAFLSQWM